MHRYERKWARIGMFEVGLILAALIAVGVGYYFAWQDRFKVPENHIGLVARTKFGWFSSTKKFEVLRPGTHDVDNFEKGTKVYALPVGPVEIPFTYRDRGTIVSRTIERFESLGSLRDHVVKPLQVTGKLRLTFTEEAYLTIAHQIKAVPRNEDLINLLMTPFEEALHKNRQLADNQEAYAEKASMDLKASLAALSISEARLELESVERPPVAPKAIEPMFVTNLTHDAIDIAPADEVKVFAWVSFTVAAILALLAIGFLILVITNPGILEPLGLVVELTGAALELVGSVAS